MSASNGEEMLGGLWANIKKTLTRPRPTGLRARRTISLGGRAAMQGFWNCDTV
jgi:hypothetical protein